MTGTIYKLIGGGKTYYGSTTEKMSIRKSKHKNHYKSYVAGNFRYVTSFEIVKLNKWCIKAVERKVSDDQLLKREGYYIKNFECVNKRVAGRTRKEYYEDNEEKMKSYKSQWAKDNREKIKENYHNNKDDINEKRRLRESNAEYKQKKKEQDTLYREKNKDKIKLQKSLKVVCVHCDKMISNRNMSRHIKTQHPQ